MTHLTENDNLRRIGDALERIADALESMCPVVERLAIAWAKRPLVVDPPATRLGDTSDS